MSSLLFSLNATVPIFLTMVVGYFLKQFHMVDDHFVKILNKFNFNVSLPALLFLDLYEADFYSVWDTKYVLFCFFGTLICIAVIWTLTSLLCKDKSIIGEFVQGSYRGSAAVLGLAFILNIYGHASVTPLMILGTVPLYNLMAVVILSFTNPKHMTGEEPLNREAILKTLLGIAKNPMIISIGLGLIASLIRLPIPPILVKTADNLAVLASPLALIGLGACFSFKDLSSKLKPIVFINFNKLILWCALFLPVAVAMGDRDDKLVAALIMLGSATTSSSFIMAKNMGHEGVISSSAVMTTTLFSSFTLTLWLFIMRSLGYI